jgi:hypothetical protein
MGKNVPEGEESVAFLVKLLNKLLTVFDYFFFYCLAISIAKVFLIDNC